MKATMRLSILLTMAVVLTAVSCGGGRHLGQPGKLFTAADSTHQALVAQGFTEEDYQLMAMPYEDRLAYLERRLVAVARRLSVRKRMLVEVTNGI